MSQNEDPTEEQVPIPLQLQGSTFSQIIRLHAWNPGIVDEGLDGDGNVVRMLLAATLDGSMEIRMGGISITAAKLMAEALTAPFQEVTSPDGIMVPTGRRSPGGIVLP